jgi:4-amino-4-deoxy-L-arabinose transferase-like glycosyltransferase
MISKIKKFITENKSEVIVVASILITSLIIRLYKINEYLTFLGDEGRDVRVVRDLIRNFNLIFIGPQTSIGNMYLGPLYYYMMAPFLWISNLNPTGPAVMVALVAVFTIGLTWWVTRSWFGSLAGVLAALFFTFSPVSIIYSRASWNPNPMPFFALLSVWSIYQVWVNKRYKCLSLTGVSLAFALQMHYLGLLLIPILGLFWFLAYLNQKPKKVILKWTLVSAISFLLLMSPLALFDLKHDGMNFKAFKAFFSDRQTTININPANSNRFFDTLSLFSQELILGRQDFHLATIAILFLLSALFLFGKVKNQKAYLILLSWLGFGLVGLSLYKQHVYAHYFGFLFPAIYIFLGLLAARLHRVLAVFLIAFLLFINLSNLPFYSPNKQLQRTEKIADLIIKESEGRQFNFGLIAKQNYDESYRYFLENKKADFVRGEDKISDQLFVVCEDGDKCQPEGDPAYQVAIFGPAQTIDQWQVDGIKIYKLTHK